VNLAELGNGTVKEDDRAVLLEGGGLQSASPKSRSSSATSPIFRFLIIVLTSLCCQNIINLCLLKRMSLHASFYGIFLGSS
jgi:hypothetical protein